ncbi:amidohydrolase [Nocardiopsis ansamitocini]|uniref:Amidase n=1 Tax=Nocardiopsis ansamitocini TaxID=1670832 RepID=A0A9W6ULX8_9ACTN|nr:amidohydrolase [Nocardiopsis ansamitocini]GLU50510.1 amidase [Nocardiopsis ansamitocini]
MSTAARLKEHACAAIERNAAEIEAFSEDVMRHPELGFAEFATAARFGARLDRLGLPVRTGLARTGVKAVMRGRGPGPCVALIGELDAVSLPAHPLADPATGAAHACGHNAQLASVAGAALGLSEVMSELDGTVVLLAAPAEEMGDAGRYFDTAPHEGVEFPVGKAELLRVGAFDDVDMALLVHSGRGGGPRFSVGDSLNGAAVVRARFHGRSAHAGSSPWLGVNALKAATTAAHALDAQRETFPDDHDVRLNYLLSGDDGTLGSVPAVATLQVMARSRCTDGLRGAVAAVTRAARAGALALGARVEIDTLLGYLPLTSAPALDDIVERNAHRVVGATGATRGRHLGACTDMGDLGHVMPVSHPYSGGAVGGHHSVDYRVEDHRAAAVEPARYLADTVIDLLADGAFGARRVLREAGPRMSVPEYLALRRAMSNHEIWEDA